MPFPELSMNHREGLLRRNWWGHDGLWYLNVAKELGFQKANEMNMAINKAIGKSEIKNLMAISEMSRESIQRRLLDVLKMNLELCAKDVFHLKEFVREGNDFVLRIVSCPAHSGTRKAGYMDQYQCACFKRAEGWLEAVGLGSSSLIRKSLVKGDDLCEIVTTPEK
jgi:hypothetical protein